MVQRRTSPPLCFMELLTLFALLACACLAERSEVTCSRQAHARISNRVLGSIFDHMFLPALVQDKHTSGSQTVIKGSSPKQAALDISLPVEGY